jgi:ATP-dependent protease HslVU (ClpYQ) peptidase subunit
MSIVVAVTKAGRTVMAADTQSNFGSRAVTPDNQTTPKIRAVGCALLGRAGWGVWDNILADVLGRGEAPPSLGEAGEIFAFFNGLWKLLRERYPFVGGPSKSKDSPFADLGGSFLVASRSGIFYVSPNLGVTRFEQYFAIGSGADLGLGALYQLHDREGDAERIARAAVETAIALNVHCGGPVQALEVP